MPRARGGAGAGAGGVQVMNNAAELVARRKRTRGFLAGLEAEAAKNTEVEGAMEVQKKLNDNFAAVDTSHLASIDIGIGARNAEVVRTNAIEQERRAQSVKVSLARYYIGLQEAAGVDLDGKLNWSELGRHLYIYFRSPPAIEFMAGAIAIQPKVRKAHVRRTAEETDEEKEFEEKRRLALAEQAAKQLPKRSQRDRVQELRKILKKRFTKFAREVKLRNGSRKARRLPVMETLLDPRSFGWTVENIFYFAFLVKSDHVRVEMDADDDLVFHITAEGNAARDDGAEDDEEGKAGRSDAAAARVMSAISAIDPPLWKYLVETLDLKTAMINLPSRSGLTPPGMLPPDNGVIDLANEPDQADADGDASATRNGGGGGGAGAGAGNGGDSTDTEDDVAVDSTPPTAHKRGRRNSDTRTPKSRRIG